MGMSTFYSVAWKPMHKPALLPADAGQLPRVYFSIAWQAPLRPLYYPAEAMPVTGTTKDAPWG